LIKKFPSVWEKCPKAAEGNFLDSHCICYVELEQQKSSFNLLPTGWDARGLATAIKNIPNIRQTQHADKLQ